MQFHSTILCFGFLICWNLSNGQPIEGDSSSPISAANIAQGIASLGKKLITSLDTHSKPNENILVSPANIFHAMAMVHMAAGGNTQLELSNVMGLPLDRNYSKLDIHSAVSTFYKNITTDDVQNPSVIVNIADGLFVQDDINIKEDYRDNIVKQYQAKIENIDFIDGQKAVDTINHWVSEKSRGRITQIVDSFTPDTKAVLASSLYFKANWTHPFNSESTRKEKFFTADGEVDVQMMVLRKPLRYVKNSELQCESFDLPYANSDYALNIILPYKNQTIKDLIPKLKDISVNQIMDKSAKVAFELKLPKTKFNVGKSLVETFQQLGVHDLFQIDAANLSDLTDSGLYVSNILHNAEIEIQEAGTLAAAVTVIETRIVSSGDPKPRFRLHVNRPFIINIYNTKTSFNLFSGIVYKP